MRHKGAGKGHHGRKHGRISPLNAEMIDQHHQNMAKLEKIANPRVRLVTAHLIGAHTNPLTRRWLASLEALDALAKP